jgi:hypothetical protein
MPYVSNAQRKKFHVLEEQGKISPETVKEWDAASEGLKLPEHVKKKAFWTGFCEKCAEYKISPFALMKQAKHSNPPYIETQQAYSPTHDQLFYVTPMDQKNKTDAGFATSALNIGSNLHQNSYGNIGSILGTLLGAGGGALGGYGLKDVLDKVDPALLTAGGGAIGGGLGNMLGKNIGRSFSSADPDVHIQEADKLMGPDSDSVLLERFGIGGNKRGR